MKFLNREIGQKREHRRELRKPAPARNKALQLRRQEGETQETLHFRRCQHLGREVSNALGRILKGLRTGKIGLCEDDDVYEVAHGFAMAFQLSLEMEENLAEVLKEQKEVYLARKRSRNAMK